MVKKLSTADANKPRRGGRPSMAQAGQIDEKILATASHLFLTQGYGETSIEAVAKRAGISKRTFYHRYADKGALFGAVMHRLVQRLRPPAEEAAHLFEGADLGGILERLAQVILAAALQPEALALHRVILSESGRFPELAAIIDANSSRAEAVRRIAGLLRAGGAKASAAEAEFAAEQFMHLLLAGPQHRALSMGVAMTVEELHDWARDSVRLFLSGWRGMASEA